MAEKKKRKHPARNAVLILVALLFVFVSTTGFYTDILWYRQLGFESVFFTQIWAKVGLFAAAAVGMGLVLGVNLYIANRIRPIYPRLDKDPFAAYREGIEKARKLLLLGIPVGIGIIAGVSSVGNWEDALLFLNATPTGSIEPQFGLDASFYLFTLPFLSSLVEANPRAMSNPARSSESMTTVLVALASSTASPSREVR